MVKYVFLNNKGLKSTQIMKYRKNVYISRKKHIESRGIYKQKKSILNAEGEFCKSDVNHVLKGIKGSDIGKSSHKSPKLLSRENANFCKLRDQV